MKPTLLILCMIVSLYAVAPLFRFKHSIVGPPQCGVHIDTVSDIDTSGIQTVAVCKDSTAVRAFLQRNLVDYSYFKLYVEHHMVCAACSCPSYAYDIFVEVAGANFRKMKELGFEFVKKIEN